MNATDLEHFTFDAPPQVPLHRIYASIEYSEQELSVPDRGADYAHDALLYTWQDLDKIPALTSNHFSGTGNPHRIGTIYPGETVLDHACGAGMDLLIAAQQVGDSGKVIGVDRSKLMCDYARTAAKLAGVTHITDVRLGTYENLPVADSSVDVVISNASINLASDKAQVFSELHRVLRPGGRLFIADLVAPQNHGLIMNANGAPTIWTQNTSSALTETELMDLAADAGFMNGHITERFDCFGGASTAAGLLGANFFANKRYEIYF